MRTASTDDALPAAIDCEVVIARPLAEVFAFYRDFANLPRFLGDVMAVEATAPDTTRWTIRGPLGVEIHWIVVITQAVENERIFYETASDVAKTRWRIFFAQGDAPDRTVVRETMSAPGGRLAEAALTLIGKNPVEEVRHNLNRLRQILETDRVTDTAYAVAGKFADAR